jgi:hypothetical protein
MSREWIEDALIYLFLWRGRWRQWRVSRHKRKVRSAAIATTRDTLLKAVKLDARGMKAVFNVGLYLLLLDQDLADHSDDMIYARDRRRRRFGAKHQALLIYEAAEDLPQMLGRGFRAAVESMGPSSDQTQRLNGVTSSLNQFWRDNREFLKGIRNGLVAHREHDALSYLEALEKIEPLEVMRCGAALSAQLETLIAVLSNIAGLSGDPRVLRRDIRDWSSVYRANVEGDDDKPA